MNVSFEYNGCYLEHKPFFDAMALGLQRQGHRVGIIAGLREKEYDYLNKLTDNRKRVIESLGFLPDFMYLWGENETIANGNLWKCQRLDQEDVLLHFDPDAKEMKRYTGRWIVKTMDGGQQGKF